MKRSQMVSYVSGLVGRRIDVDGYYGSQCVDLIMHVCERFFGYRPYGNAIDYTANKLPSGFKRYSRGQARVEPGDILVWKWGSWDRYGHIGVCTSYDGVNVTSVEQNVDGGHGSLTMGGPARYRTRTDACLVSIIKPPYEAESVPQRTWSRVTERATFTLTVNAINVRSEPTLSSPVVAVYKKGQSVHYDSYCIANGYVWISYISYSGKRRYMAIGEHNGYRRTSVWGTFR